MALSKSQIKYYLTNLRTRKSYFFFQVFQLLWSVVIIILAIISDNNFRQPLVLYMELVLLICMAADLLVIRFISQGALWTSMSNKIDCVVLAVFGITFLFVCFTNQSQDIDDHSKQGFSQRILQTDDIILITVIVLRYALQIFQMVRTIKNTRKNMQCQKQMKDVDLNQEGGHSVVYDDHQVNQDQILRSKITGKHKQTSRDSSQPGQGLQL